MCVRKCVSRGYSCFLPWNDKTSSDLTWIYRPYALTSRLHNNDAMLGVKTCRAARTCFAGRAHWRSPSQSVCAPGPARRCGMQGFALWLHAWRWCTWRASFDPQHHGGALLWRHMHMVYSGAVTCVCKLCYLVGYRKKYRVAQKECNTYDH